MSCVEIWEITSSFVELFSLNSTFSSTFRISFGESCSSSFLLFLKAWFVAITNVIAKGSNTKIKINMNMLAVFLTPHPVSSLIYFMVPSSLPEISFDSNSSTFISNAVILSLRASTLPDILSRFSIAICNWVSNDLRFALFALVTT